MLALPPATAAVKRVQPLGVAGLVVFWAAAVGRAAIR
jgi:hypothetical protein